MKAETQGFGAQDGSCVRVPWWMDGPVGWRGGQASFVCVCVHVVVCMLVYSLWTSEIRRTSLRKHRLGLGLEMS